MLIKKTEKDKNAIKNLDFNREIIKHKKFTVQLLELDIAYLYLHPNALMEVEDFVESLAAYHKLANGKRKSVV